MQRRCFWPPETLVPQEVYNSQTKGSGDFDEKGGDNNG